MNHYNQGVALLRGREGRGPRRSPSRPRSTRELAAEFPIGPSTACTSRRRPQPRRAPGRPRPGPRRRSRPTSRPADQGGAGGRPARHPRRRARSSPIRKSNLGHLRAANGRRAEADGPGLAPWPSARGSSRNTPSVRNIAPSGTASRRRWKPGLGNDRSTGGREGCRGRGASEGCRAHRGRLVRSDFRRSDKPR